MSAAIAGVAPPLRLADLVRPLDPRVFAERHWRGGAPLIAEPNRALLAALARFPRLASAAAFLAAHVGEVALLGPGDARARAPRRRALAALESGKNLYIERAGDTLPDVRAAFAGVATDLGLPPWQIELETFAGCAGGLSSRHYDHDINFQILLSGSKSWTFEANRHIEHPLRAYHPRRDAEGRAVGFAEEAYAARGPMPEGFDPEASVTVRVDAGSVVFLPRGCWHEVRSLTDTWAVNLVIKGVTWADAVGKAIAQRLQREPRFRAYCEGHRGAGLAGEAPPARDERLRALREAASRAARELSLEEVELSPMGGHLYAWAPGRRAVAERESWGEDDAPVVGALLRFEHAFAWSHVCAAAAGVDAGRVYRALRALMQRGHVVHEGRK